MGDEHAARLAAIVQSSDDAIISKDLAGVIRSWNPAAEKLFGYVASEAIGRPITELIIPPERLDEERDILERIARGEAVEHFETERITKGGQRVRISLAVSPVRSQHGTVIGASKVARDIGEQRRADEFRARLAAIVEFSDDAIIGKTLEGVITSWNPAARRLFGYTGAEAIGRSIRMIVPADRWVEEDRVLAHVRRGDRMQHFETVRLAKGGSAVAVSLTVSPIRSAAGEIIGASTIARDITERRRVEAERGELLAREQAAREEAEALNRSKDQFLAVLSHELRTPLNAIFGWASMLHAGKLDEAQRLHGTEVILRNAKAQLQLVDDLLDVSRIITGNMRLEVRPVELRPVVEAALDSVRPAATAKEIKLDADLDESATVVGAEDRLQQIVWNLVMNAVKFTPPGGGVAVIVRRVASRVEIVVRDTGEGIATDLLPYVFDRFRQGDSTSTRAHGGLGIGLALVRHLVDLHGGVVRAESAGLGRGATFIVKLPVAQTKAAPRGRADAPGVAAPTSTTLRDVRVLLVDDEEDGLELARIVLENAGADVRLSTSGHAATDLLSHWGADVLVLDIEMPREDGYALLRRIRADQATAATPAIALTAYAGADDRKLAFAAGFNLHLAKPVDPAELIASIAALSGRPRPS